MNLTIFDMARDVLAERSIAYQNDMTIQFTNSYTICVSLPVVQQLGFFKFVSSSEIEQNVDSDGKQIFLFVQNELCCPTLKIFSFMYHRLMRVYLKHISSKLITE